MVIGRRFHLTVSVAGVWRLLHHNGLALALPGSPCPGTRRAGGGAVEERRMATGRSTAAAPGAWIVFEDEVGSSTTPPRAHTWGRHGHTPVVRVRGRSFRRILIAALVCYRPGERSRLIYRPRVYNKRNMNGRASPGPTTEVFVSSVVVGGGWSVRCG
ncbi:hypothetical protein [Streptomyces sp. NPDC001678]|uniref:hypothetical protein n=1 Tax=Streptomyces sp. NPDC001678 TaxID=3364599 RepID=UPI00368E867D